MKSLLLKDWYALVKQMRFFLTFLVLFCFLPGGSMVSFAIVYAAMLPMTALAFDERSHWDDFASMMPYSPLSIVLSKYILGYIAIFGTTLLAFAGQNILALLRHTTLTTDMIVQIPATALAALLIQAVSLPFLFRFGTEKGRLFFLMLACAFVVLVSVGKSQLEAVVSVITMNAGLFASLAVIAVVLINIASVALSRLLQKRKNG